MTETTECTRALDIEIPAGEVEREYTRIAQNFQKRARIPGFRPGKAPLSLVQKHFSSKIREETLETLVPAHLRAAFERESLEPVSTPTLDELNYEPGQPVKFKARFEVLPQFELGDYRAIRVQKASVEVTSADVDGALEALRQQHSHHEDSDATEAAEGLVAVVEAVRLPDEEGGEPEAPQELPIEVGGEQTLPEFTQALKGMKLGEQREMEVTYQPDYPSPSLAGQTRKYQLKLLKLQKKVVPELSDAFVKEHTGAETAAELRERVEANMRADREHKSQHEAEDAVIAQLIDQTPFPVPNALVERQVDAKIERELRGLAAQGVDPRKLKLDWSKLRDRHTEAARREVQTALILDKIADQEKIEAAPERVEEEIENTARQVQQTPAEVRQRLTENGGLDRIQSRLRQDQVLNFLLSLATAQETASV